MPYGFNEDKSKYDLSALLIQLAEDVEALESLQTLIAGKADANHSHDASEVISGTLEAGRIPNISTTKLTSGILGFARGGTNSSSVSVTNTISSILTAATGVSVVAASYAQWGKLAQVDINVTTTAAKGYSWTLGTVKSGKRPAIAVNGVSLDTTIEGAYMTTNGVITVFGSVAKDSSIDLVFTYVLE